MTGKCKENRIAELKAMDVIMRSMNHESAWFCWINHMPDETSEEDYADIAEDEAQFADCAEAFIRIMKYYLKYGMCLSADTSWGTKYYGEKEIDEDE